MIKLENVEKLYDKKLILKSVNYTFKCNNIYLIAGDMGTGKSTLLKIILGVVSPSDGTVVHSYKKKEFTYNEPWNYLYENATCKANLRLYKELFKTSENHYNDIYTLLDLNTIINEKVCKLSTGNKKKLSLACSLLNENGKVIILDEPFTNLDKKTILTLMEYLIDQKNDKIVLITSHQSEDIKTYIDVNLVMKEYSFMENQ